MNHRQTTEAAILLGIIVLCGYLSVKSVYEQFHAPSFKTQAAVFQNLGSAPSSITKPNPSDIPLAPENAKIYSPNADNITWDFKGYQLHQIGLFSVRAVLLSKRNYSGGDAEHRSVLSPCDFAIGWGPMSTPSVLKNFTYFQKDRFFYYAALTSYVQQAALLQTDAHVANCHLIPANDAMADALQKINPRDIVTLEGDLVEVYYHNQRIWKSSLSFNDTGDGACKLIFLRKISWYAAPPEAAEIPLPNTPPQAR